MVPLKAQQVAAGATESNTFLEKTSVNKLIMMINDQDFENHPEMNDSDYEEDEHNNGDDDEDLELVIDEADVEYITSTRGGMVMIYNDCMFAIQTKNRRRNSLGTHTISWRCRDEDCGHKIFIVSQRVDTDALPDLSITFKPNQSNSIILESFNYKY